MFNKISFYKPGRIAGLVLVLWLSAVSLLSAQVLLSESFTGTTFPPAG